MEQGCVKKVLQKDNCWDITTPPPGGGPPVLGKEGSPKIAALFLRNLEQPILALEKVSKIYQTPAGPVAALNGVDLDIKRGDFVAVTGPSGSGKTTLLHLASLLDVPTMGRIFFVGEEVGGWSEEARSGLRMRKIGMIFQRFNLLPRRSVLENVMFRCRYLGVSRPAARRMAEVALDRVGLAAKRGQAVRLLSGGEMQRVAIARAIAWSPELLLADEPTGNLDSAASEAVMGIFDELRNQGLTIVLVTHNLALLPYCSRQVACKAGTVVG